MKIGVLALQGAFIEHAAAIRCLGEDASEVRLLGELDAHRQTLGNLGEITAGIGVRQQREFEDAPSGQRSQHAMSTRTHCSPPFGG